MSERRIRPTSGRSRTGTASGELVAMINQLYITSASGSPTATLLQSMITGPRAVTITLSGWRSKCSTESPSPIRRRSSPPAGTRCTNDCSSASRRPIEAARHGLERNDSIIVGPSRRSITMSSTSAATGSGTGTPWARRCCIARASASAEARGER
ncbi:MAG: hypothetical protein R2713_03400 [Ilumatobacteraceae bacterium]